MSFFAVEIQSVITEVGILLEYLRRHSKSYPKSIPMSNSQRNGFNTDLRSLLKHQHKKVYSICRLFAHTYKEHQYLFTNIIAAASQNIRHRGTPGNKETLVLRACVNMAALHMIALDMPTRPTESIDFKSSDYQRAMMEFHDSMGNVSDYDKFRLFLEFEKVPSEQLADLTGMPSGKYNRHQLAQRKEKEIPKKNFIPYIKEKLVWS